MNMTTSGLEVKTGNVSGSLTSTGSFGALTVGGTTLNADLVSGKVGIGKTNPSYALDVVGDIQVSNTIVHNLAGGAFWGSGWTFGIAASNGKVQAGINCKAYFGRQLVIGEYDMIYYDYDHAVQLNPTIFLHSGTNPNVDNTQWLGFTHQSGSATAQLSASIYT